MVIGNPRLWCAWLLVSPVGVPWAPGRGRDDVPKNAKVALSCDRETYFLGENVLVHFKLENTGGPPFRAEFGHDYRGAPRALRFEVTATDQNGKRAADPYPNSMCMGGLGNWVTITPEKPFWRSVPISRYVRLGAPGTYTVVIRHDFGWKESAGTKRPGGRILLRLKMPSKEQAEELVRAWLAEKPYGGHTWGKKSKAHADSSQIRCAEYLGPLTVAAENGDKRALAGIGSTATPEATRVLVGLLDAADEELRKDCCRQLGMRLPDPYLQGELGKRNPFEDGRKELRRWLVARSWRGEFSPRVREAAAEFLGSLDKDWVATGAYMLECVGLKEDTPLVVAALDREIRKTTTSKLETGIYPIAHEWQELAQAEVGPMSALEAVQIAFLWRCGSSDEARWGTRQ